MSEPLTTSGDPRPSAGTPDRTPPNFLAGSSFAALPRVERERMLRDLETYRRELPRLLEDGEDGRFALIHDDKVQSVWDSGGDAMEAAAGRPASVYQVKPQDIERLAQLNPAKEA